VGEGGVVRQNSLHTKFETGFIVKYQSSSIRLEFYSGKCLDLFPGFVGILNSVLFSLNDLFQLFAWSH